MGSEWRPRRLAYPSGAQPHSMILHGAICGNRTKPRGAPRLNGRHVLNGILDRSPHPG
jgi:transposase